MKKAKVVLLSAIALVVVIALVLVLVSIFATKGILKYYDIELESATVVNSSTKLDYGTKTAQSGDLALFVQTDATTGNVTTRVYNVASNQVVYTQVKQPTDTSTTAVYLASVADADYFRTVTTDATSEVTGADLYTASGSKLATATKDPAYVEYNNDVIVFNRAAYAVNEDGALAKAFDIDDFTNIASTAGADKVGAEYLYFKKTNAIVVTDKMGNVMANYDIRSYDTTTESFHWYVLANGNVMVQYTFVLADNAEDFDFTRTVSGKQVKYDVVTELLRVGRNSVKDVDTDYLITGDFYNNNVNNLAVVDEDFDKNMAYVQRFEDGVLCDVAELVVLDNWLNIDYTAADIVAGATFIAKIADDLYMVQDRYNYTHIVNAQGKIQKTFADNMNMEVIENYIVSPNAIYNFEFEKVYDAEANGYTIVGGGENYVIMTKDVEGKTEVAKFANGTVTVIVPSTSTDSVYMGTSYANLYCIAVTGATGTVYNYYNASGTLVGAFATTITSAVAAENGAYLATVGTDYYRLNP